MGNRTNLFIGSDEWFEIGSVEDLYVVDRTGNRAPKPADPRRRDHDDHRSKRTLDDDDRERDRGRDRDRERERERDRGGRDYDRERDRDRERERGGGRDYERDNRREKRLSRSRSRDRHLRRHHDERDYDHGRRHREEYERRRRSRSRDARRPSYGYGRGGGGSGRRSPSPPKPFGGMSPDRESHPIPLEARIRHLQNWDSAPKGFERITADKAKLLGNFHVLFGDELLSSVFMYIGIFPPPGNVAKLANFVPPVLDPALAAMISSMSGADTDLLPSIMLSGGGGASGKQNRRLYVAGFPPEASEDSISMFLSHQIRSISPVGVGEDAPVVNVHISHDRTYAFVDFRSAEDATALMGFDGIAWEDGISQLRIKRPREYQEGPADSNVNGSGSILTVISNARTDVDKFALIGLPSFLQTDHAKAILEAFGELKCCQLLCNPDTDLSLGIAVAAFKDSSLIRPVTEALDGLMMGSHPLSLRPLVEVTEEDPELLSILSCFNLASEAATGEPTNVLLLLNMLAEDDLVDGETYAEILQDVQEEASKYGKVKSIQIPRKASKEKLQPGVGKVFIEFGTVGEAQAAHDSLDGRQFADRTVLALYFSPTRYQASIF